MERERERDRLLEREIERFGDFESPALSERPRRGRSTLLTGALPLRGERATEKKEEEKNVEISSVLFGLVQLFTKLYFDIGSILTARAGCTW